MNDLPMTVMIIWWAMLVASVVVVLPLVVYLLHRAFNAARMIEHYAARSLEAGLGVAENTANIAALDETIEQATRVLDAAGRIEEHTGAIASVLAGRAKGGPG